MFEKKRGKRFLASVMALVMLLSLAPVGALAAENEDQQENTAVTLPANETDPKPVETGTANTNEDTTPPPSNEGIETLPANNNNTPVALPETPVIVKPAEGLIDEAFGVDADTSKDNGIAEYKGGNSVTTYSVSGPTSVKVGETIALTCDKNSRWHAHNWTIQNSFNKVAFVGETNQSSVTVKGLKEGTATISCGQGSMQINVTDPQYVIRFYVSGTGTENSYTEKNKYGIENQPNSTFADAVESNPLTLYVSPGYAILTEYNDTAKNITTSSFKNVSVSGDAAVREWLTTYANDGVPTGLTDRENVETIVEQVNAQYTAANDGYYKDKGITLPLLQTNYYNGFRFVGAHYVDSGESTIHVDVQLVKNTEYTVRYEPNGGAENAYDDPGLYQKNDSVAVKNNMFTKAGYTFAGWNTEADGSGTPYQPGSTITIGTENVTLYAQWTPKKTYEVKYHLNYDGSPTDPATKTNVQWNDSNLLASEPDRANYTFNGWYTAATGGTKVTDSTTYSEIATDEAQTSVDLYAQWKVTEVPPTTAKYTVNHYKWDVANKKYLLDESKKLEDKVAKEVTATAKTYPDYTLNTQDSTLTGTVTADNQLTLNLYYDIDKIGGGENKDKPDGIPDRYQVTINYVSSNTNWGSVNRSKEVITLINKESSKWAETGTVTAPSCTATSAGGKCYFVNWTNKDNTKVGTNATLEKQPIENAKGGDVYTFTANFDRSSGGGSGGSNRPKPPVVEIPDDVPTGLNGKDHYAYIIGYGNNDVRPQNNITRAEVATIFFRLLTDETREANMTKSNGYNDVKDGDWFCYAVSTLSKMGIIKGYEDGSFKPNDPISRAEFAAIAARFDPDGDKTPASFFDVTSHWAKDEISIAANHGWIKGYEDGSFKPDQKITRAETMTLVNRVLNRLPETKDDLHKDMKTWVDNMDETAWYYLAVQEATNSHYFKNKTGTKFEQWTDLRDTRDWSELEK